MKHNKRIISAFLPVGADFNVFKPEDKLHCREKLGLSQDNVIALYVGQFYRLKSVDLILDVYYKLKHTNFEVLFVGGREENDLYSEVVSSGCKYWKYIGHDQLREIICASDFYIHPVFNPQFGGFDVSLIEAMACNRPVLSPQLSDLNFKYDGLGISMESSSDCFSKTKEMIHEFRKFTNCREIAIKHLDANCAIIDELVRIYEYQ